MFGSPLAAEPAFSLTVDPYWILVSLVQFLILYWLLRRFLWVPVTKALETRAAKIREGLELAEEARLDRERLKQEVETLLAQARAEANAIADRTAQAAEAAAAATRAEAKTEADRLPEREEEELDGSRLGRAALRGGAPRHRDRGACCGGVSRVARCVRDGSRPREHPRTA